MNKPLKSTLLDSAVTPPAGLKPPDISGITSYPNPTPQPQPPGTRPVKVALALPSGRTWEARTATCVAGLSAYSALQGIQIGIINLEGSMITKQRNDLVEHAKKIESDFIFMIDTDMVIPPDSLCRLLAHGKDVVGATYNKRVPPYETLGKLKGPQPTDDELRAGGLREAELLPGGVLLIRMSVFDKIQWPYFFESYQWPGENGVEALKNFLRSNYSTFAPEEALAELDGLDKLKTWLNATWEMESKNNGWQYFSEDLNYFRRLAKAGIISYCDMNLTFESKHLGTQEVTCNRPPVPSVVTAAVM